MTIALECWVIGHRGAAAVWPENTLPSFRAACEAGAMMIEFDVQQSVDGKLFVFHDHTLERLCEEPLVASSLPWAVLSRKDVGRAHGQPIPIPLVEEVFATFQRSVFYNVELKTETVHFAGIEKKIVAFITQYGLGERVLVSSFHHQSLREIRRWNAELALGLLLSQEQARHFSRPADIACYAREYDCCTLHPDFRLLRQWPELVTACHEVNIRVFPWTVDDPEEWQFLVGALYVDGIITNTPGKLYDWLLARARSSSAGHR